MKQIYNRISFLIHPILLSVYPIIFLYSHNISQIAFKETLLPAAISIGISIILLIIFRLFLKNMYKASLTTSLILILFFSYGHINKILYQSAKIKKVDYILPVVYLIFLLIFLVLIIKSTSTENNITHLLNVICLFLILLSAFSITKFSLGNSKAVITEADLVKKISSHGIEAQDLPDIYYIILDGYAGEETLKNIYNFDNSEFLNFLKSKGFFIASKSKSNYIHTTLSLASSLNMAYVNDYIDNPFNENKSIRTMFDLVNNNRVQRELQKYGYTTINVSSTSSLTGENSNAEANINPGKINEFNFTLLNTTFLLPLLNSFGFSNLFREKIINTFKIIPEIAKLNANTYTFAHIMAPHPPYFLLNNNLIFEDSWCEQAKYIKQIIALNLLVKKMILKILNYSGQKPIIIIQGDHGPLSLFCGKKDREQSPDDRMLKERFYILNALLLPKDFKISLSSDLSPINTFRIIFNQITKANVKLLENKYYYSDDKEMYHLKEVTSRLQKPY